MTSARPTHHSGRGSGAARAALDSWWVYLILGTGFGWILSRSGAADYNYIQQMFLFQSFQLYGIIGTAVAVTLPGLWLLKRHGRTLFSVPLKISPKAQHPGNMVGGVLFGIGWSLTGMCPGPILVNVGEGKVYALGALAGVLVGAAAFGLLYERLVMPLHLPALKAADGRARPAASA